MGPALTDAVFNIVSSFLVTVVFVALPLLVIRRISRGYRVKQATRRGVEAPQYGAGSPIGLGVYLLIGVTLLSFVGWIMGRADNPLASGKPTPLTPEQVSSQLDDLRPDTREAVAQAIEQLQDLPGFRAMAAFESLQESMNDYFAVDPRAGNWSETQAQLADLTLTIQNRNDVFGNELAEVRRQSDLPSSAPDLQKLRNLAAAIEPWAQARVSFNDSHFACESLGFQEEIDLCQMQVFDEWEPVMISTVGPLQNAYAAFD